MTKIQVNKSLLMSGAVKEIVFLDDSFNLPNIGQSNMLYVIKSDSKNGGKQTLYLWNGMEYTPFSTGSSGGGTQDYQQITKLGVTASVDAPRQYSIPITFTSDFLRAPIEILKFKAGQQNVVKTEISFDNSDATDFEPNDHVIFDGSMKLKLNYNMNLTEVSATEEKKIMKSTVNKSDLLKLLKVEVM